MEIVRILEFIILFLAWTTFLGAHVQTHAMDCDEHRGKRKKESYGAEFEALDKAVKQKRQVYLCQQPAKNRLQQALTLTVSECKANQKSTGRVVYQSIGEKQAVTYTYRQKTIDGLERTFSRALHRVDGDVEFQRFKRKNNLTIVCGGAKCTEDAHVSNKSVFMFCVQKIRNETPASTFSDEKQQSVQGSSLSSSPLKKTDGFGATYDPSRDQKNPTASHSKNDVASSFVAHEYVLKSRLPGNALAEMEKCGKNCKISSDVYTIQAFSVDKGTFKGAWKLGSNDIFVDLKEIIGQGGMRVCHAAKIGRLPPEISVSAAAGWVAKFYLPSVPGDTWSLCKKDVQTQAIAEQLCKIFRYTTKHTKDFGDFPRIFPSFLVQRKGTAECFTIEPKINLKNDLYRKFMNNDGVPTQVGLKCELGLKCMAFAHWSMSFTGGKFLLCDLQGTNQVLTDIQVASPDTDLFGVGNLGRDVFESFKASHICNRYCNLLGLNVKQGLSKGDDEIAVLRHMGITAKDVVHNMLTDLSAIMKRTKPCGRMDFFDKGMAHQNTMPPPPADGMTDLIANELNKVFGAKKSKEVLLVLVPEVRDKIKLMAREKKQETGGSCVTSGMVNGLLSGLEDKRGSRHEVSQRIKSMSVINNAMESKNVESRLTKASRNSNNIDPEHISKELLSHMQRQTELMELLIQNQQQVGMLGGFDGMQHIVQPFPPGVPFAPAPAHPFPVPGAPFIRGQPLAIPAVQPLPVPGFGPPLQVPLGQPYSMTGARPIHFQVPAAQPLPVPVGQPGSVTGAHQLYAPFLPIRGGPRLEGCVGHGQIPGGQPSSVTGVRPSRPMFVPNAAPFLQVQGPVTGGVPSQVPDVE